jgi:hypothetical protein
MGPHITFPSPLPALNKPNILPKSAAPGGVTLLSSLTIPAYVAVKPPAKKPYVIAKISRSGWAVEADESPQRRKTEMAEPRVDIRITFET